MQYLTRVGLAGFHSLFLSALQQRSSGKSKDEWGFPSGFEVCDTFRFSTDFGDLFIGHLDRTQDLGRWWIPLSLESNHKDISQRTIDYEMSIPSYPNKSLSVHYANEAGSTKVLHKGKFTIGYGSLSMNDFWAYYETNPGKWSLLRFDQYRYLDLATLSDNSFGDSFVVALSSLASFAKYIHTCKQYFHS